MGIQPIDLQTVYQQQSNVSKLVNTQQQAALTEQMQQQNNIQRNLENSKKVQQTNSNQNNAAKTNKDGSNSAGYFGKSGKDGNNKTYENENPEIQPKKNPYNLQNVGTIIDITR